MASSDKIDRRSLFKGVAVAGAAAAAATATGARAQAQRKRYVIVGTGGRSGMYQDAIYSTYKEHAELVGICDKNPGRIDRKSVV